MRRLRCTVCEDLYVAAVLTSTAALGSITHAPRGTTGKREEDEDEEKKEGLGDHRKFL